MPDHISRKFTRLYLLALAAVAFLSVLGQVLIQLTLHNQLNDSGIVNYAGRQRFLSQQIVKNILLLTAGEATPADAVYLDDLRNGLAEWEKYHRMLRDGHSEESVFHPPTATVPNDFLPGWSRISGPSVTRPPVPSANWRRARMPAG